MRKQNRNVALLTIKNELKDQDMDTDTDTDTKYSESASTVKEVDPQSEEAVKVYGHSCVHLRPPAPTCAHLRIFGAASGRKRV
jgi:hypothetical protein